MSYQFSLAQELERKNNKLFSRLDSIRDVASTLLTYTAGSFSTYTPHDFKHSESVEELLSDLIPDEVKEGLSGHELFFLIVSAWLHDWGMICKDDEDKDVVRETHHLRTAKFCEELYDQVLLDEHEGFVVGLISKGHRKVDLKDKEYNDRAIKNGKIIRVRFLSAALRIADECDVTYKRTPKAIYYSIDPDGKSRDEFDRHLSISGVGFFSDKHKVEIGAIAKTPKAAKALRVLQRSIQEKLDVVVDILSAHGVPLEYVGLKVDARGFVDKPIAFAVNKERIVDLLIGTHLYGRRDVAVRELIQNAIDACTLKSIAESDHKSRITIVRESEDSLVITDNGIGMDFDEAKAFLSEIGSSYYGSGKYQEAAGGKTVNPISKYGIGVLSCFLVSNGLVIETQKKGE